VIDRARVLVERTYPVQRYRAAVEVRVRHAALWPFLEPGESEAAAIDAINALFALERSRPVARSGTASDSDARGLRFSESVGRSFLPPIIDLVRRQNLPITLVRVQRRPEPDGPPVQSASLLRYTAELQSYLAARGVDFYDFNGDPETPLSVYGEGDHIAPEYLDRYTDLFARRLESQLR
jgi:hypothetical protein